MTDGAMGTPPVSDAPLTDDERAELAKYRSDREKAEELARQEAAKDNRPPTHYLHLDNGQVVESAGTMTIYDGHQVLNAAPIPADAK